MYQPLKITDTLIMKVAKEKFNECNEGILDNEREYIQVDWINKAHTMLTNFNDLIIILNK